MKVSAPVARERCVLSGLGRFAVAAGIVSLASVMAAVVASMAASVLARAYLLTRPARPVVRDPAVVDAEVVAVLGAGLRADGTPTRLLARRVDAGVSVFERSEAGSLIMSGADGSKGDEPGAMAKQAVALGVPTERIMLDRSGVDTAATCRRLAADHPGQTVVLVTQSFHADRTAYLAAKAGLNAVILATPDDEIRAVARHKARARELPASIKALFLDRF